MGNFYFTGCFSTCSCFRTWNTGLSFYFIYITNYSIKNVNVCIVTIWCKVRHKEPYKFLTYLALIYDKALISIADGIKYFVFQFTPAYICRICNDRSISFQELSHSFLALPMFGLYAPRHFSSWGQMLSFFKTDK